MFWQYFYSHEWAAWAWLGSAVILGCTWFSVHIDVLINRWNGHFFDLLVKAVRNAGTEDAVPPQQLMAAMLEFSKIAGVAMIVSVLLDFFTSHWCFRWRTALTNNYVARWESVRHIEGASQRVQEDTMRFAKGVEGLSEMLLKSIMQLFSFLPLLSELSENVSTVPLVGHVPHVLVWASLAWAIVGTVVLAVVGIRLPGLEFQNQLVEAAYRKELTKGEDDPSRAPLGVCLALFGDVRKNYYKLFLNFVYFNVAKYSYLQAGVMYPFILLAPSISAKALTMGQITQTSSAFGTVTRSFQYLVLSWKTIVEMMSIVMRLRAFERGLKGCGKEAESVDSDEYGSSSDDLGS